MLELEAWNGILSIIFSRQSKADAELVVRAWAQESQGFAGSEHKQGSIWSRLWQAGPQPA